MRILRTSCHNICIKKKASIHQKKAENKRNKKQKKTANNNFIIKKILLKYNALFFCKTFLKNFIHLFLKIWYNICTNNKNERTANDTNKINTLRK